MIFDLERLRDRATVLEPDLLSEGVDFVMVNGVLTVDGGEFTDELPGVVVVRGGRGVSSGGGQHPGWSESKPYRYCVGW